MTDGPRREPTPTLLDDLERAAAVVEAAMVADVVRHGGKMSRDFPDRLRAAGVRLREEMATLAGIVNGRHMWATQEIASRDLQMLERINGGPVKP